MYDPAETWSLATVVTLCGVHRALPLAAGQRQSPQHAAKPAWLARLLEPLLQFAVPYLAKYRLASIPQPPLPVGNSKGQTVVFDTRGMWIDSFEATSWAHKHLFYRCKLTHQTIAIQVLHVILDVSLTQ